MKIVHLFSLLDCSDCEDWMPFVCVLLVILDFGSGLVGSVMV